MGYSKADMLNEMSQMVDSMKPHLERHKIPSRLEIPEHATELPVEVIRLAYYWLKEIIENEFKHYYLIWREQSEEHWNTYMLWDDFDEFTEVILLRRAANDLRKVVCSIGRPDMFKRTKVNALLKKVKNLKSKKNSAATGSNA